MDSNWVHAITSGITGGNRLSRGWRALWLHPAPICIERRVIGAVVWRVVPHQSHTYAQNGKIFLKSSLVRVRTRSCDVNICRVVSLVWGVACRGGSNIAASRGHSSDQFASSLRTCGQFFAVSRRCPSPNRSGSNGNACGARPCTSCAIPVRFGWRVRAQTAAAITGILSTITIRAPIYM